jgi:DNA polymerase
MRVVLAMAGQHDKLKLIAEGGKPYLDMGAKIFKRPIDKDRDPFEYVISKNTVLGCGFQMGWETFLRRYAPGESEEFGRKAVGTYREEWAPEVPKLWAGLEEAAIKAVWDHRTTNAYGIEFKHEDIWLTMRLHSGRKLYYAYPQQRRKAMPWDPDDIRPAWSCMAWKKGRWMSRDMYGGLITQNADEGLSRDIMCSAMFKCERENLPIVLTVHDEIIAEPLTEKSDPAMLKQIMCDRDPWVIEMGVPIGADTWAGPRYKK